MGLERLAKVTSYGLTSVGGSVLVELVDIGGTSGEDARAVKVGSDELIQAEVGWVPSTVVQATVEPVLRTVWLSGIGATPTASTVGDGKDTADKATEAATVVAVILRGRWGWGGWSRLGPGWRGRRRWRGFRSRGSGLDISFRHK